MARSDVRFPSGRDQVSAWLYQPERAGPSPVVVMAHGFAATRDMRLDAYAERFCGAGLGALLFDYRHFGASGGSPRQLLDIASQLDDWRRAVAFARTLPWADPARIGLFGASFSGGHVLCIGAEDGDLAAIVAQCPFTNGLATAARLGLRNALLLTANGVVDEARTLFRLSPHYVPAVAAPGRVGFLTTPDAQPGIDALTAAGTFWDNRVAARIAFRTALYRPGTMAARVVAPTLWCLAEHDALCPADDAARWAARAPRGEVRRYPIGHFDFFVGEWFETVVGDQLRFLRDRLDGT